MIPDNSPSSPGFQPSAHHTHTPGTKNTMPSRYEPFVLNSWVIRIVCLLMIFLGVALQIALFFSATQNGFAVPPRNVFSFASTQFLTSFFPILLVVPLAQFWPAVDWSLRWYQPYVTLFQDRSPASPSVLLDYVALNRITILYNSWRYRHYLIYVSALIALSVLLFQPLAGSLLQVRQVPHTIDSTAFLMGTIGLSPNIDNLDAFLAASGFTIASVYGNLVDPPFVHGIWSAGQFQPPPGLYLNATLAVNTTAIQTEVNCANPTSLNVTNVGGSYVASATFPGGCSASNTFNSTNGVQQFDVFNAGSCASQGSDIKFQPVVFWFYLNSGSPQVASVYCSPTMNVFTVQTSMNLTTSSLGPCTIIEPAEGTNNVTGSPQNGRPYNGVAFDSSPDLYVSSRAQAINFALPDAIYRSASRQRGGPLSVFQDPYGFLNITKLLYTQHLAVAAQTNYFLASNSTVPAKLTTEIPRLFVEPLPALILTPLFITIGFVGLGIHYLHTRARSKVYLTSPAGSITSIVALASTILQLKSRSGFGQLLLPYDDERQIEEALAGLFQINQRTGGIITEEDFGVAEGVDAVALLERRRPYDDSIPLKRSDDSPSP